MMLNWRARAAIRYLAILVLLIVVLAPFLWIALNSVRPAREILGTPTLLPTVWTLDNYRSLFQNTDYWLWTRNSLVVATYTVILTLPLALAGAYSIYRTRYRGRNVLGVFLLSVYVFPTTLLVVPTFGLFARYGLVDSLLGLAIMNTTLAMPFAVWLLQSFLRGLPPELEEAAAMDGVGRIKTIRLIIVPQIAPGLAAVTVFAVIISWTEFLFASVLTVSNSNQTLPVGMANLIGQYSIDWGRLTAGGVATALPILVLFTFAGRWFVRGASAGAVK
jgi:multiple sugar transport system permease protein